MISVAIDGPAGAGKSTLAKAAAAELGYIYIDTGALYRAIALACIKNEVSIGDEDAVKAFLPEIDIRLIFFNGEQHILLNDSDVSGEIRSENVSMAASRVSAIPDVRQVKIFLTASPEKRARRRVIQLQEKGEEADFDKILFDIVQRDYNDSNRKTAPLKAADDAINLDTSDLTLEESVERIISIIKENTI